MYLNLDVSETVDAFLKEGCKLELHTFESEFFVTSCARIPLLHVIFLDIQKI
jgi:hypothetical protein